MPLKWPPVTLGVSMGSDPNRSVAFWCRIVNKPWRNRIIACIVGFAIAPNGMARFTRTFTATLLMASMVACQIEALRHLYTLSKTSKRVSAALSAKDWLVARGMKRDVWVLLCFTVVGVGFREISGAFDQGMASRCVTAALFGAAAVFAHTVGTLALARRAAWVETVVPNERETHDR